MPAIAIRHEGQVVYQRKSNRHVHPHYSKFKVCQENTPTNTINKAQKVIKLIHTTTTAASSDDNDDDTTSNTGHGVPPSPSRSDASSSASIPTSVAAAAATNNTNVQRFQRYHYHQLPHHHHHHQVPSSTFCMHRGLFFNAQLGEDIIAHPYTKLQAPKPFPEQPGELKTGIVLGHNFIHMFANVPNPSDLAACIVATILNDKGIPVYNVTYNVRDKLISFTTLDKFTPAAIVALERRVIFDRDCFYYAKTRRGVEATHHYCETLSRVKGQGALITGTPHTAMTAFINTFAFSRPQKTCFPSNLRNYSPRGHNDDNMLFFNEHFDFSVPLYPQENKKMNAAIRSFIPQKPFVVDEQALFRFQQAVVNNSRCPPRYF